MYNKNFTWKIFGNKAKAGDRLSFDPIKEMKFSQMVEDENGVFVFLPKEGHSFYSDKGSFRTKVILKVISKLIKIL